MAAVAAVTAVAAVAAVTDKLLSPASDENLMLFNYRKLLLMLSTVSAAATRSTKAESKLGRHNFKQSHFREYAVP